jgi:hypothetical protein
VERYVPALVGVELHQRIVDLPDRLELPRVGRAQDRHDPDGVFVDGVHQLLGSPIASAPVGVGTVP